MSEDIDHNRRRFLGTAAATMAAAHFGMIDSAKSAVHLPIEGELPSLGGATAWLNSRPLKAAGLHGKVVLIVYSASRQGAVLSLPGNPGALSIGRRPARAAGGALELIAWRTHRYRALGLLRFCIFEGGQRQL